VSWVLAVDFGTSNTTAAFADDGGVPQLLQVENSQYLPSVVVADGEGNLLTGKAASRQAMVYPERTERVPKRALVAGGEVVLGGRPFAVEALAGAVLSKVYAEAVRFHGGSAPAKVILTHPARWGEILRERLRGAAGLAGVTNQVLLAEPEAAAWYYAPPVAGQLVAVFDLGGGTLDTAVLQAADGGFVLAGPPGGDAELGGEDFDELLLDWVTEQARKRDAELWAQMEEPRAARDRAHLRADVTAGKETLSEHTTYEVPVPGFAEGILVRRPDLEELISEPVGRAVEEMRRTITTAGVSPGKLAGLYLTGGSSRVPVIAQRLAVALGVLPQLRDDPKAVVALGALKASAAPPAAQPSRLVRERTVIWEKVAADQTATAEQAGAEGSATAMPDVPNLNRDNFFGQRKPGSYFGEAKAAPRTPLPDPASIRLEDVKKLAAPTLAITRTDEAHLAWTPDCGLLAVGGNNLEIWDVKTGKRRRQIIWRVSQPITSLAWSRNGLELATVERASGKVKIWKDDILRQYAVPGLSVVSAVAWSPAADVLAVGGSDGTVCLLDSRTGKEVRRLPGRVPNRTAPCVAWSPDGAYVAGPCEENGVAIWSSGSGACLRTLKGHDVMPARWAWSRDGKLMAVGDHAGVRIWDPAAGAMLRMLTYTKAAGNDLVRTVEWTDDSRYVVAFRPAGGRMNGKVCANMTLWHAETGTQLQIWNLYNTQTSGPAAGIGVAPASKQVASVTKGANPTIRTITGI